MGSGQSHWWLGERDAGIEYRREAFAGLPARGVEARGRRAACDLPGG